MNPPAALFGAMNRERKPFTYTPGGLDLSEIKSERMAKRLMRNAMNQGVPDTPVQSVKSPPASGIPVAIPNFNCLPVQVFPTFQLPANPKSLLRTRSNPDGSSEPIQKSSYQPAHSKNIGTSSSPNMHKSSQIPNIKSCDNNTSSSENFNYPEPKVNYNLPDTNKVAEINNIIKPLQSVREIDQISRDENQSNKSLEENNFATTLRTPYGHQDWSPLNMTMQNNNKTNVMNNNNNSHSNTNCIQTNNDYYNDSIVLPEISYDAEYLTTLPEETQKLDNIATNVEENIKKYDQTETNINQVSNSNTDNKDNIIQAQTTLNKLQVIPPDDNSFKTPLSPEIYYEAETSMPEAGLRGSPEIIASASNIEILQKNEKSNINGSNENNFQLRIDFKNDTANDYEQKEVKTVKKQTEKKVTENSKESQNGDTEAEVVVKLPSKKSEAKTETQVEVETKVLPDGTVEEITKTTTKTTIDGKTETKITTATKTIPKEEVTEEEYEEEEEEETDENFEEVETSDKKIENAVDETEKMKNETENGTVIKNDLEENTSKNSQIITNEEKLETSTTKKVIVIQSESQDSEEEVVEEEEVLEEESEIEPDVEEVVVIRSKSKEESKHLEVKKDEQKSEEENRGTNVDNETENEAEDEKIEEEEIVVEDPEKDKENKDINSEKEGDEGDEVNEEVDEDVEEDEDKQQDSEEVDKTETINKVVKEDEKETDSKEEVKEDEGETEETFEEAEDKEIVNESSQNSNNQEKVEIASNTDDKKEVILEKIIPIQQEYKTEGTDENQSTLESKPVPQSILKDILREPSVPLEKVEEVEIKPIGPTQEIIKKSHTEIITTKTDKPSGALSTQTEYNVIENYVTVNRTTKTLDHAYEQAAAESSIPIIRSYIPPYETSKSYQPTSYTPQPGTERRHSLLLDRISVERQIPVDTYQNNLYNNNQSYQETQYLFEPQSEILTESNVKPSTINKNQQWYQQTKKENYISNNVSSTPTYEWTPPQQQPTPKPQTTISQQPSYQPQPQYAPEPQYQSSYIENTTRDSYKTVIDKQNVSSYTPKPTWVNSTYDPKPTIASQPNQYSFKNQSTESYQNSTQFNSSYVPPPWEQDTGYNVENRNQDTYQPPPLNTFSPKPTQTPWQQTPPPSKFTKPKPTSYIPPAPNQSFVKPVSATDPPKLPGRKTYYSEYERRYISVPESTYIPTETKYQAQPDPSPTYYYDNNEPAEIVEPQWRKELREFTEKTQTTTQINETSVRPPWEDDPKYGNGPSVQSTPTWSQTLRPQSWRERSYEPEYTAAKEWPKTNTLGRGRPQSSYVKNNMDRIPERARGVSVDRYNPNSYQSPVMGEHPPVQSQTLDHSIHPKPHYNPNVPGYHARASAEPRDQPAYPQQRLWGDSRSTPIQSRSFKYLQWITGTED